MLHTCGKNHPLCCSMLHRTAIYLFITLLCLDILLMQSQKQAMSQNELEISAVQKKQRQSKGDRVNVKTNRNIEIYEPCFMRIESLKQTLNKLNEPYCFSVHFLIKSIPSPLMCITTLRCLMPSYCEIYHDVTAECEHFHLHQPRLSGL